MFLRHLLLICWFSFNAFAVDKTTSPGCPQGKHWVVAHHRRAFVRADGTLVSEADVSAHCQKNPSSFRLWNSKLKDGKPSSWWHPNEQPSEWTTEERERVLEALDETPDFLKDKNIYGIYRMHASDYPNNPGANNYSDIVLYDNAFGKDYILTHVLDHEFAHRLFDNLSESERTSFRTAGKWKWDKKKGSFGVGRPESAFVRKNDMLSPVEDFADSITAYIHQPEQLKKLSPPVYNWMKEHFGSKLKVRSPK